MQLKSKSITAYNHSISVSLYLLLQSQLKTHNMGWSIQQVTLKKLFRLHSDSAFQLLRACGSSFGNKNLFFDWLALALAALIG